ncbi:daunorubicin resistance protein DrrA family ABC transporter ATP-binding protein [Acrocarpospora macrocephala]|uniref:Daunorubicin resistance protein DrrA family ABC transporter ATP-binding protein n=2 Tax=Acrocarpospora macrocephala TaxID=150177 RepID=A0A5M3WPL1_9ACTN|nr:daunorubicin resistance protein DrrA family ABC transporter ATP-binding protein [Acrocarpospora macrocephala]
MSYGTLYGMIRVTGLAKRFGATPALDSLDLHVPEGQVHGLLGPNGAGKTTLVRILTTLLRPGAGQARVAGFDVVRQAADVRRHIGLVGQHAAVDELLTGRQNLAMFARLSHLPPRAAAARADELLDQFGLADAGSKPAKDYSGGMRRRLDLAAGLILAPPVLFLDEPTTGLDPRARDQVWSAIRDLAGRGATILLTTQYLEEADRLADKISIIDGGRLAAAGTPAELKATIGGDRIEVVAASAADLPAVAALLGPYARIDADARRVSAPAPDRVAALTRAVRGLEEAAIAAEDIGVRRPTLDEVFLRLTERTA